MENENGRCSPDIADALREQLADAKSTLEAWFDLAKRAEDQVTPILIEGLRGYLKTSQNGGMPKEDADTAMAVLEDFCRIYVGRALVPVLRSIAEHAGAARSSAGNATASDVSEDELTKFLCGEQDRIGPGCDERALAFTLLRAYAIKARDDVAQGKIDPATVEACAKHLEREADLATNSLHCGDNSATIAATHRVSRAYYEAAKSIRALAVTSTEGA